MSTVIAPQDAAPYLAQRWNSMTKSRFDFAALQNGTVLCECPSLQAWQEGDKDRAIELMFEPEYLANVQEFFDNSLKKESEGVSLIRVHLFDEERYENDKGCHDYLDWLREHFRQLNLRWCAEKFHWLPKSVCDQAGLVLPKDDFALYDGDRLLTSQYDEIGTPLSRTFYELDEDFDAIAQARSLVAQLSELVAEGTYEVKAAEPPLPCPWR